MPNSERSSCLSPAVTPATRGVALYFAFPGLWLRLLNYLHDVNGKGQSKFQ